MEKEIKHFTTKQEKEEIVDTISLFLQQPGEIYAAYLFGSFVTRESFADIDLGVLLRQEPEDILEYEIELESKLEKLDRFRLDVRVLNRAPISFAQNVIKMAKFRNRLVHLYWEVDDARIYKILEENLRNLLKLIKLIAGFLEWDADKADDVNLL